MEAPTPASLTLPTSSPIPQRTIDGDETIALGEVVLVASKSQPGFWYPVVDGRCPCDGHRFRHTCRHLERARLALRPDQGATNTGTLSGSTADTATPASAASPLCRRCQKRPVNPRFSQTLCTRCVGWLDEE